MDEELTEGNKKKIRFYRGFSFTLFIWFMTLSLGPLTVIGVIEYHEAKEAIVADQYKNLFTINLLLTQTANHYADSDDIQSLFDRTRSLGEGQVSYLVDADRTIRFGTGINTSGELIRITNNPLIDNWLEHLELKAGESEEHSDHLTKAAIDEEIMAHSHGAGGDYFRTYKSFNGEQVLGIFLPVMLSGTPMVMVSEISQDQAFASISAFRQRMLYLVSVMILLVLISAITISRKLVDPIKTINRWVNKVASGNYVEGAILSRYNEIGELSHSFSKMTERLRAVTTENEKQRWLQDGMAGLNDSIRGDKDVAVLCHDALSYLAHYLGMPTGAVYILNAESRLQLIATFAWQQRVQFEKKIELGEGLVGQVALERKTMELTHIPDDYCAIESGLGSTRSASIIIMPLVHDGELKGVIEFACLDKVTEQQKQLLEYTLESVAIAVYSAQNHASVKLLLDKNTTQTDVMEAQQEELKAINEELEARARVLEESEEELKAQSDELQKSNAELEQKSDELTLQKEQIEQKNRDIEQASTYKSEFLANMSHELRTPLNSLLLLARVLADNREGNLTRDQVTSAEVILSGGQDLLATINDILDLSRVEAGKMSINLEDLDLHDVCMTLQAMFNPVAESKHLEFRIEIEPGTPQIILSDSQRLLQIIKNFLSNAFKFTEKGGVYVRIFSAPRKGKFGHDSYVFLSVRDTGIGIPKDKQQSVFQSFQQADGSTSRKYGGTGLGLAISRELSGLLGGGIEVESKEGEGSTFTLFLPANTVCSLSSEEVLADSFCSAVSDGQIQSLVPVPESATAPEPLPEPMSDRSLLLIEDDDHFAKIVEQVARQNQFEYARTTTGSEGLKLASLRRPGSIILDLGLPDMDGHDVLKQLKEAAETSKTPVHIISARDPEKESGDSVGYLMKPVTVADLDNVLMALQSAMEKATHHVLILDLNEQDRLSTGNMLTAKGMNVGYADSTEQAEALLKDALLQNREWQCLVMDLDLGGRCGLDFLAGIKQQFGEKMPSVVVQMVREPTIEERLKLREYTGAMVMKGAESPQRLMDEVNMFLQTTEPKPSVMVAEKPVASDSDKTLQGRKIMLVDDDLRNTFALSQSLEILGLEVVIADNGKNALALLGEEDIEIDLVLMDVMMPEMDGYEATRKIREIDYWKALPVIFLTAKAMSNDRAKCLEAGGNDYITKPVDMDKLVEMLKTWLS